MLKVGILVSGGGTNLQAIIDRIENQEIKNAKIVTVVSNRKKAYALERAKKHGLSTSWISPITYETREAFDQALIDHFQALEVDLVVLAGYLVVLGSRFINAYRNRIINVHPSLLPAFSGDGFYGLRVHEAALERGVKVSGATIHFVDEGTDTGPIVAQKTVEVLETDTPETLQKRIMEEAEWQLLPEVINQIAKGQLEVRDGRVYKKKLI
ncbi:MAG: phosphoribosylglycinamide formyltransferase [Vallitaleaceae bacterium]|nr:phosphoribosylglycinamide formyltransferase [Vallitaleaceae bacterium]